MNNLLTEPTDKFAKSVLDVLNHKHTQDNIKTVHKITEAVLIIAGNQDLLIDFAKYYVANIIQQRGLI